MFKPEAIRILVNYLKDKKEIASDVTCLVCDDCESFEEELEKLAGAPLDSKYGFIVRCQNRSSKESSAHVTAIYLHKTVDGWRALQLDAAGHSTAYLPLLPLKTCLKARVYHGGEKRQSNGISCAVFALYDLANLSHQANIFSNLDKQFTQIHLEGASTQLKLEDLSLDLLKVTQDAKRLKFYAARKLSNGLQSKQKLSQFLNSLEKYIVNSSNQGKEINDLARKLHLKYERHVLEVFLKKQWK